jgi:hypothetical protein
MTRRAPEKIISGGQTGADRGGLDAAIELGVPHGGCCPKGRRAEDGRIPGRYKLEEAPSPAYRVRTERNVLAADGTLVFTFGEPGGGSALTIELARRHAKPVLHLDLKRLSPAEAATQVRRWVEAEGVAILNVAGSREGKASGIRNLVWEIMKLAFQNGT